MSVLLPFTCEIIDDSEDGKVALFSGAINEEAELPEFQDWGDEPLVIDLSGVGFINSLGIRRWLHWINGLSTKQIVFEKVPTVIMSQVSVVSGFLPDDVEVKSFFVPYMCEDCDTETVLLYSEGREYFKDQKRVEFISVVCPSCQQNMDMDPVADRYFYFFNVPSPNTAT